jgi:16S rRNA (uracil1498-N3)-methyltransferase
MKHQFLVGSLAADLLELEANELNHAKNSLRIKPGEQVRLTDGRGGLATAEFADQLRVIERFKVEPIEPFIHVVQALAKGDRDELAIQTSTELGALRFTPWQSKRSVIKWDEKKAQKGIQRWQSIATEAMKQSHQAWLPEVKDLARDTEFDFTGQLIVLDPDAEQSLTDIEIGEELTLVVGPEGGISESELDALKNRGGFQASLGNSVFRTSTAAPAAIATIRTLAGWG